MDHSEVKHLPKVDHTPAELDEASMVLLKAAQEIERDGLWKRGSDSGTACAVLAIVHAGHWGGSAREAEDRLALNLGLPINDSQAIYDWNDRPERTQAEVVAKLRAVALGL